jgi:hypothetical protein
MRYEFGNPRAQRALAEPDHAIEAGFLDAAHESLGQSTIRAFCVM